MTNPRLATPRATLLLAATALLSLLGTGCARMIGMDEDPADSAVGAAKAAQGVQNERYNRVKEATGLIEANTPARQ